MRTRSQKDKFQISARLMESVQELLAFFVLVLFFMKIKVLLHGI